MARRTWEPQGYPVRDPRGTAQQIGRIVNPPRALKIGGRGESTLFNTETSQAGVNRPAAKGPVSDRGRGRK